MKLYRYISGMDEKYGPAENEQDAYERRCDVDSNFHFLPVRIEEVTVEGYTITVTSDGEPAAPKRRRTQA